LVVNKFFFVKRMSKGKRKGNSEVIDGEGDKTAM